MGTQLLDMQWIFCLNLWLSYRPVARIFFGGVRSLERKGYFCQDFFLGGCVVWRGRGIFARGFLLPLNQYITNSGMIIVFYYRPTQ